MKTQVQIIKNKGKPEWAVIPYNDYIHFQELELIAKELSQLRKKLNKGEEEFIPRAFADRLISGENPIRVWRSFRGYKQAELANAANISTPYLSQLENGARAASMSVLKRIADTLKICVDDLIEN